MNSMKKKITILALLVSSFNVSLKAGRTDLNIMVPDYKKYRVVHCEFRSTSTIHRKGPNVCDVPTGFNLTADNYVIPKVDAKNDGKSRYYVEKNVGEAGWVPVGRNGKLLSQSQNREDSYFGTGDFKGYAGWNWIITPEDDVIREGLDSNKNDILYREVNGKTTYDKRRKFGSL